MCVCVCMRESICVIINDILFEQTRPIQKIPIAQLNTKLYR